MKPVHILAIVVIAIAISVIVSTAGDASAYVNFTEAYEMANKGNDDKIHVVGELPKDAAGHITGMQYEPSKDPNYFKFLLADEHGKQQEVIYYNPKPQDFERSEKVVVVGGYQNDRFIADKILMKCPSKYEEKNI